MKKLRGLFLYTALLPLLFSIAVHGQSFQCPKVKLEAIHWLVGMWKAEGSGGVERLEIWEKSDAWTLRGRSIVVKDQDTIVAEHLTLIESGSCLIYVANPRNQQPTAFTLVDTTSGQWVFENPEHDFPTRVIYQPPHDEILNARITGRIADAERKIEFQWHRVTDP